MLKLILLAIFFSISFSNYSVNGKITSNQQPKKIEGKKFNSSIKRGNYNFNLNRNFESILVDSSSNGWGLAETVTRPIATFEESIFISYRQFAGYGTTHGQLGGAFFEQYDDEPDIYFNLNANGNPPWGGGGVCEDGTCAQARYPNALLTQDYPIAIWNEYTAENSTYGGRPYYTYDEFGWEGNSFAYPMDIDVLWDTEPKDHWVGSAQYSYDEGNNQSVINVVFDDWTREGNYYLFHTEFFEDGYAIFQDERLITGPEELYYPDGDVNYSGNLSLSMNNHPEVTEGHGILGLSSYLNECRTDRHALAFKLTDNHGDTFYGDDCSNFYFIPDNVYQNILEVNEFKNKGYCINNSDEYGPDIDYDGDGIIEEYETTFDPNITGYFDWYEYDFRVDRHGNIHILAQLMMWDDESQLIYSSGSSGFYHFTIKKEYINDPGPVNSESGWNWTYLYDTSNNSIHGVVWDLDGDGQNDETTNLTVQLSFDYDDEDIVWAVFTDNVWSIVDDYDRENHESCWGFQDHQGLNLSLESVYYSYDIFIAKSEDGGRTWSNPVNLTNSTEVASGGYYNAPDEITPRTPNYSYDENVIFMYQMPNWNYNEVGGNTQLDFMQHVLVGYAGQDIDFSFEDEDEDTCSYDQGDVSQDGVLDINDIVQMLNYIFENIDFNDCQMITADFNEDNSINIADLVLAVACILYEC